MITTAETKWNPQTIMLEHQKTIEGFENYEISDTGFIRNRNTQQILKQRRKKDGYMDIILRKNKKQHHLYIHRLVALAFIENPNNVLDIDHIDSNKENNRIENLRFATKSQNNANKNIQINSTTGINY